MNFYYKNLKLSLNSNFFLLLNIGNWGCSIVSSFYGYIFSFLSIILLSDMFKKSIDRLFMCPFATGTSLVIRSRLSMVRPALPFITLSEYCIIFLFFLILSRLIVSARHKIESSCSDNFILLNCSRWLILLRRYWTSIWAIASSRASSILLQSSQFS